jgi:hypothetical protein
MRYLMSEILLTAVAICREPSIGDTGSWVGSTWGWTQKAQIVKCTMSVDYWFPAG